MIDRRNLKSMAYAVAGVTGGVALLYLPRVLPLPGGGAAVWIGSLVLALAWTLFFALAGFRSAEEFVQDRSRFAWYWGSLIGLVTVVPLVAMISVGALPWLIAGPAQAHAMALGVLLTLGVQFIGFVIVSAWWRATKQ